MNLKSKAKWKLMAYECAYTSVAVIGNIFFEISKAEIEFVLVGFDDDIYYKSIPIGAAKTATDFLNFAIIYHLN